MRARWRGKAVSQIVFALLAARASASEVAFRPPVDFASSAGFPAIATLDSDTVLFAYQDNAASGVGTLKAANVDVAAGTFTFGTAQTFNAPNGAREIGVAAVSSTEVVVAYLDPTTNTVEAVLAAIDPSTLVVVTSAPVTVDTGSPADRAVAVAAIDADHVVIAYRSAAGTGRAAVGFIDRMAANPLSFAASQQFEAATSVGATSVAALDATRVVIAYSITSSGRALVASVDKTTHDFSPSLGSTTPVQYNAATSVRCVATRLDSGRVMFVYSDAGASSHTRGIIGTVSGNTISFASSVEMVVGTQFASSFPHARAIDATRVVVTWDDGGLSRSGFSRVVRTHGESIYTCSGERGFNFGTTSPMTGATFVTALDANHVVVAYVNSGAGDKGTARVGTVADSILLMTGFETSDASEIVSLGTGAAVDSTVVRSGSGAYSLRQETTESILSNSLCQSAAHIGLRFSFRASALPGASQTLASFLGSSVEQFQLRLTSAGALTIQDVKPLGIGANTVTVIPLVPPAEWYTIFVSYASRASGHVRVWLDSGSGPSLTWESTHSVEGERIDEIRIAGPVSSWFDDIVVTDGADRPPAGQIVRLLPKGPGIVNAFGSTDPAGVPVANHHTLVDDLTPFGGTDNVNDRSNMGTTIELFDLQEGSVVTGGVRFAVKPMWVLRRDAGGSATHFVSFREQNSGVNQLQQVLPGTTDALFDDETWATSPWTGDAWTKVAVDALQLGAGHGAGAQTTYLGWVTAMLDYAATDATPTALDLLRFDARPRRTSVELRWTPSTATGPAQFDVLRADAVDGPYTTISTAPIGSDLAGSEHRFVDRGLSPGRDYFYAVARHGDPMRSHAIRVRTDDEPAFGCRSVGPRGMGLSVLGTSLLVVGLARRRNRRARCESN